MRALGRLKENPELGDAVKLAQHDARDRSPERSVIDGETCLLDAWEYLMSDAS